jgi:PAS domain S-box-containing protein
VNCSRAEAALKLSFRSEKAQSTITAFFQAERVTQAAHIEHHLHTVNAPESLRGQQRYLEPEDALLHLCFAADTAGRWRHANDRWLEFTGSRLEAALGDGWLRALHPNDANDVRRAWKDAVERFCRFEAVCRLRRRDGHYRWFLLRASPMTNALGAVSGWVGRGTDVDIIKRAHKRLSNNRLNRPSQSAKFESGSS